MPVPVCDTQPEAIATTSPFKRVDAYFYAPLSYLVLPPLVLFSGLKAYGLNRPPKEDKVTRSTNKCWAYSFWKICDELVQSMHRAEMPAHFLEMNSSKANSSSQIDRSR